MLATYHWNLAPKKSKIITKLSKHLPPSAGTWNLKKIEKIN